MKVQVSESAPGGMGYFDHVRRRIGDVFMIPDQPRRALREKAEIEYEEILTDEGKVVKIPKKRFPPDDEITRAIADDKGTVPLAFSSRWMEPVAKATPERVTTAPEALKDFHDKTVVERAQARGKGTGSAEVI